MKNNTYFIPLVAIILCFYSCQDVLDKKNLGQISGDIVWQDVSLITAYVNQIYREYQSVSDFKWDGQYDSYIDEAGWGCPGIMFGLNVAYGQITPDNNSEAYWPYQSIRKISSFFENIDSSPLEKDFVNSLKGQVHFMRAFEYFEMVKRYGGVPIITKLQNLDDSLFVKRNKTSECFTFIIEDLNKAIQLLPDSYSSAELGKITKSAAYAFKGRVLLYKASPQFNPTGNRDLWNDAYIANKEAIEYLSSKGYGLYMEGERPYGDLWFNEMNKEVILAVRHNDPEFRNERDSGVRALSESFGWAGACQPTQELVEAFPMANGLPITDVNSGYNFNEYWVGRDPRFYDVVVYNGAPYPLSGKTDRIQYTYKGSIDNGGQGDGFMADYGTSTGYYSRKAINTSLTQAQAWSSSTDWIELRYAELMLNFAETANEIGNTQESYDMLKEIRHRAGISSGVNGLYGLQPGMNSTQMRSAIIEERRIELCFENKRFWDIRRWRMLHLFDGKSRHGLETNINVVGDLNSGFTHKIVPVDIAQPLKYPEGYYFFPLDRNDIRNNPNLEQTKGWENGTFDPLL